MLYRYSKDITGITKRYLLHPVKILVRYCRDDKKDTGDVLRRYSKDTAEIKKRYLLNSVKILKRYSKDTAEMMKKIQETCCKIS